MPEPDRIHLTSDVHKIMCRWIVFFTLISNDTQPSIYSPLSLIRRLSLETHPSVSREELKQLTDYVNTLLDGSAELPSLVASEAWQMYCWLETQSGGWLT